MHRHFAWRVAVTLVAMVSVIAGTSDVALSSDRYLSTTGSDGPTPTIARPGIQMSIVGDHIALRADLPATIRTQWIITGANPATAVLVAVDGDRIHAWAYAISQYDPLGPSPTPSPTPPIPTPTPPSPLSTWAQWSRDAASAVSAPQRTKSQQLAGAFDGIASKIASGALADADSIVAASIDANRTALGTDAVAWVPWFDELRRRLNAEADAGRLATAEQYRAIWCELAVGLRSVQ